jgi:hypothetical protein
MSELKPDEVIPSIIAAAVAAAGPMGTNEGAWKAKVNRAIPHITSMINDGSRQWKTALEVLEASVFTGTYVRHELEESSQRVVVHVDVGRPSENYPDGIEPIRTHRIDNAAGKAQLERIERFEPGQELALWRTMEKIEGSNKSVRTLVHFETRPKRQDRTAEASSPQREQRGTDRAEEHTAPEPARQSDPPLRDLIDSERLANWRTGAREALTQAEFESLEQQLRKIGLDFNGTSEVEWADSVRPIIRSIINRREE